MSKLVVEVCKVEKVEPIPNADKIELAFVKGWQCIVGKGERKSGDLVLFIPPDSILTEELIEIWDVKYLKNSKGRIGVVKIRGVYSYGLIVDAPPGSKLGQDFAEDFYITKWEPKEPKFSVRSGKPKSRREQTPGFHIYTDIEHGRNWPDIFVEGDEVHVTEKIHGTNFRCGRLPIRLSRLQSWINSHIYKIFPDNKFVYGSHKVELKPGNTYHDYYGSNPYWYIVKKYKLAELIPVGMVLYGEIYGPKMQDLTYGRKKLEVVFYDFSYDGNYMDAIKAKELIEDLGLPYVPVILGQGSWFKVRTELFAGGNSLICEDQLREGCVVRPIHERRDPKLGRVILKYVNPEYLARKKGTEFH